VPRPPTPALDRPPQLTERDRELLAFLAEHRFALAAQLGRLLGSSAAAVGRRLGALRAARLVEAERPLRHDPTAWAITRRGLAMAGGDLSRPRPIDLATYRHDVGVGWLAVGAHRGVFGELSEVVSERRMRSQDRRSDRPAGAPTHGIRLAGEGPRLHYPDLVLVTAGGHRVALELELSTKSPRRRERILAAYADDRRIDRVAYLVPTRAAADAIARSAARVGAADTVQVQRFSWAGGRAPGVPARDEPARAARRAGAATSGRDAEAAR
jgi:DNA-binding transcriptional ArsR family regulator